MFARRVAKWLGFTGKYDIHVDQSPSGYGAAEKYVRDQYPPSVKALRNRKTRAESFLLVITDADKLTVHDRLKQLEDKLSSDGQSPRTHDEPIAVWVPKWSIETWVLYLCGTDVTEARSLKNTTNTLNFDEAAGEYFQQYKDEHRRANDCLPSLLLAYSETKRVDNR